MFILPKVASDSYHVLKNSASLCEDQAIIPQYLGVSLITPTGDVLEKLMSTAIHRWNEVENSLEMQLDFRCYHI